MLRRIRLSASSKLASIFFPAASARSILNLDLMEEESVSDSFWHELDVVAPPGYQHLALPLVDDSRVFVSHKDPFLDLWYCDVS